MTYKSGSNRVDAPGAGIDTKRTEKPLDSLFELDHSGTRVRFGEIAGRVMIVWGRVLIWLAALIFLAVVTPENGATWISMLGFLGP